MDFFYFKRYPTESLILNSYLNFDFMDVIIMYAVCNKNRNGFVAHFSPLHICHEPPGPGPASHNCLLWSRAATAAWNSVKIQNRFYLTFSTHYCFVSMFVSQFLLSGKRSFGDWGEILVRSVCFCHLISKQPHWGQKFECFPSLFKRSLSDVMIHE